MQLSINVCVYVCVYDSHFVAQHESEADRAAVQAETVVESGTEAKAVAEAETESAGSTAYALFVFANKFNNENNATKNSLYANKGLGRSWPDSADRGKSQQQQQRQLQNAEKFNYQARLLHEPDKPHDAQLIFPDPKLL